MQFRCDRCAALSPLDGDRFLLAGPDLPPWVVCPRCMHMVQAGDLRVVADEVKHGDGSRPTSGSQEAALPTEATGPSPDHLAALVLGVPFLLILSVVVADLVCISAAMKGTRAQLIPLAVRIAATGHVAAAAIIATAAPLVNLWSLRPTVGSRLWWALLQLPALLLGIAGLIGAGTILFGLDDDHLQSFEPAYVSLLAFLPIISMNVLYALGRWIIAPRHSSG